MLVRFNVGNFLSFNNVQEFSMIKGKAQNKNSRIYETNKVKLLKFAAIFGANASGKSNLVSSILYAQHSIVDGIHQKGKVSTFRLDESCKNKPSYFEFEIVIGKNNYSYGFEILLAKEELVSEWLIELSPNGKNKNIFVRDITNGKFESDLKIVSRDIKTKFAVYSDDIKKNKEVLFLAEMNRAKSELYKESSEVSILKLVYEWFTDVLDVNYPDEPISRYSYFRDVRNKNEICRVIKSLGTGITNFLEQKSSMEKIKQEFPEAIFNKIENDIQRILRSKDGKTSSISIRAHNMFYIISLNEENDIIVTTIAFNHGNDAIFDFNEESDGTLRILDLIEILFAKKNKVYVIDEIDRSLHPQLTYKFIDEFLKVANERDIQLIITTHESRLLDFGLLRQDEIWITNKNDSGSTELYSLGEYNVRFDKKVDKAYLEGRYGGVPIFSSIFPVSEENEP